MIFLYSFFRLFRRTQVIKGERLTVIEIVNGFLQPLIKPKDVLEAVRAFAAKGYDPLDIEKLAGGIEDSLSFIDYEGHCCCDHCDYYGDIVGTHNKPYEETDIEFLKQKEIICNKLALEVSKMMIDRECLELKGPYQEM